MLDLFESKWTNHQTSSSQIIVTAFIFADLHSPLAQHKLALGVPPPDVVDDGELYQRREDKCSASPHPNVQSLQKMLNQIKIICVVASYPVLQVIFSFSVKNDVFNFQFRFLVCWNDKTLQSYIMLYSAPPWKLNHLNFFPSSNKKHSAERSISHHR